VTDNIDPVADTRSCAQCGALFAPRREHARFCSARCRVAWNREHVASPVAGEGALDWSIAAMHETTGRLQRASGWDRPHSYAAITEAVWWVTMVDATLVRYHPEIYGEILSGHNPPKRAIIENTFAGLRFVRNRMGYEDDHDDFIQPRLNNSGSVAKRIAAWTWKSLPEPDLTLLQPRGQEWEMTRYEAYQAQLANRPIGDTFSLATAFLQHASERGLSHL
jgi:endogenous inhibitor of DNA gyrase (YacG/DUF329 family)